MWTTTYDIEKINEIQKCKEKIGIEENKIKDIEFNIKVYTEHMLSQIHNLYSYISEKALRSLWEEFNKENKSESFKAYYKYINEIIIDNIISDTKCKYKKTKVITGIVVEGYSSYAYNIHFVVDEKEFRLNVPIFKNIQEDTLIYTNYGMYSLGYFKGCCNHIFAESYDLEDLKKAFKEFIENKKYETL